MKGILHLWYIAFIILFSITSIAYKVETGGPVHQHITNESKEVWRLIPYEIKQHLKNPIIVNLNYYKTGDDIIDGSGEEDVGADLPFRVHFWQPDNPQNGKYNDGLESKSLTDWFLKDPGSSYQKAQYYWNAVVFNYLLGDKDYAYYLIGKIAHLLEDASQPSHVHLDCHPNSAIWSTELICDQITIEPRKDDSVLEEFTGNKYLNYSGKNHLGEQYNYEALPEMEGFNWKDIKPKLNNGLIYGNEWLFRLFWYTAQKSQFWASDDVDGNNQYRKVGDNSYYPLPNLWPGVNVISNKNDLADDDINDEGPYVQAEADAMIPHAMKATAGLYRLFWDTVNSYHWPTYHHDNRRTGFTILKGDLIEDNKLSKKNFVIAGNDEQEYFARPSSSDLDFDGGNEVVISFTTGQDNSGLIYNVEYSCDMTNNKDPRFSNPATGSMAVESKYFNRNEKYCYWTKKWIANIGQRVSAAPSLGDIDGDDELEVVVGGRLGTLFVIDEGNIDWTYTVDEKPSPFYGGLRRGKLGFTAIDDLDNDGKSEIIFVDNFNDIDWNGELYVLEDSGSNYIEKDKFSLGNGGAEGAPSVEDIDFDDKKEVIVPTFYGIKVFDYDNKQLNEKCSTAHSKIYGAPVIYDIDYDNEYEVIFVTTSYNCLEGTCLNRIYIIDPKTCAVEYSIGLDLTYISQVAPAIANLDNDYAPEIVVIGEYEGFYSEVQIYDSSTRNLQWRFNDNGNLRLVNAAPNIADINGDNKYEIILGTTGDKILVLKNDGNATYYNAYGKIASSPIIADLNGDGRANIALKRAGSPISVFTSIYSNNNRPVLNYIENITAIAGDLIDINESGTVLAYDPDGQEISFDYSYPFNESGLWQSSEDDARNHSAIAMITDGNLSAYHEVVIQIFNSTTKVVKNFSDDTTEKGLGFIEPGNQTVTIKIPKKSKILYSKLRVNTQIHQGGCGSGCV